MKVASWAAGLPLERADDPTVAKVAALAESITADTAVSLKKMLGRERTPRIALARHRLFCAMWRVGFSLSEIALLMGLDHTTVRGGIRKVLGPDGYKAEQVNRALDRARAS